jgi:hypothetical protein
MPMWECINYNLQFFQKRKPLFRVQWKKKIYTTRNEKKFSERGCKLIENEYKNASTKMKAICKCGNIFHISWNNLRHNRLCNLCGKERIRSAISGNKHYAWIEDREEAKLRRMFSSRCRAHLQRALKRIGSKKESKTYDMLGYNSKELQHHIVNHPNWNRVKNKNWHIDHVFPVKAFNDYKVHDIKLINCLENLQPVDGKLNLRKNGKYDSKEFERWLKNKGYELIVGD